MKVPAFSLGNSRAWESDVCIPADKVDMVHDALESMWVTRFEKSLLRDEVVCIIKDSCPNNDLKAWAEADRTHLLLANAMEACIDTIEAAWCEYIGVDPCHSEDSLLFFRDDEICAHYACDPHNRSLMRVFALCDQSQESVRQMLSLPQGIPSTVSMKMYAMDAINRMTANGYDDCESPYMSMKTGAPAVQAAATVRVAVQIALLGSHQQQLVRAMTGRTTLTFVLRHLYKGVLATTREKAALAEIAALTRLCIHTASSTEIVFHGTFHPRTTEDVHTIVRTAYRHPAIVHVDLCADRFPKRHAMKRRLPTYIYAHTVPRSSTLFRFPVTGRRTSTREPCFVPAAPTHPNIRQCSGINHAHTSIATKRKHSGHTFLRCTQRSMHAR